MSSFIALQTQLTLCFLDRIGTIVAVIPNEHELHIFDQYEVDFSANGILIAYENQLDASVKDTVVNNFKVGDRVKILSGIATPFVGMEGTIDELQTHDEGIETMTCHILVFEGKTRLLWP
jgi:transcription antitermination factor NusG